MTRDDVIRMAREAGCDVQEGYVAYCDIDDLCELVRLAAAAEREACKKLCDDIRANEGDYETHQARDCSEAISERGAA